MGGAMVNDSEGFHGDTLCVARVQLQNWGWLLRLSGKQKKSVAC